MQLGSKGFTHMTHNKKAKQSHTHQLSLSGLFLFELILATAFLALSSVVCIRMYLGAETLSRRSAARTHAVSEAQNIAASWLSHEEQPEVLHFDSEWNVVNENGLFASDNYSYEVALTVTEDDQYKGLSTLTISVYTFSGHAASDLLYELEVNRYDA